jgi:hypothetical protein
VKAKAHSGTLGSNSMFCLPLRGIVAASAHSSGARGRGALSVSLVFAHPSTSRRHPPPPAFASAQKRFFAASSALRAPPPSHTVSSSPPPIRRSILSRLLPASLSSAPNSGGASSTSTSLRKIAALARPERRPLLTAIGLLVVSSSVSLSIPFTVGKLIDYFTSPHPVGWSPVILCDSSALLHSSHHASWASQIFLSFHEFLK